MYGVPKDLPIHRFVGDFLSRMCLDVRSVYFEFGRAGTIVIEGNWALTDASGCVLDRHQRPGERESYVVTENRSGLVVSALLKQATGTAERDAAIEQLGRLGYRKHRVTVGGDKAFDTRGFVASLREIDVTPHVAQNTTNRSSAIDARTTRHPGYGVSRRKRKRIEEVSAG